MKLNRMDIRIRDPYIVIADGKYYMYGTCNMANAPEYSNDPWVPGFSSFVSEDLETWEGPFHAFDKTPDFWGEKDFWAAEVHEYKGAYYMFATFFSDKDGRRSQILKSDNPLTGFKPWAEPLTPEGWWCLDATLYVHNGTPYCVYCHEWLQTKDGEMYIVQMSDDLKTTVGEHHLIFKAGDAPWSVFFGDDKENCITDGPYLRKLKNGKVVMMWSSLGEGGYTMGMAVNDGNDLTTGWRHVEKPLYGKDGGHGMIFEKDGKLFIAIHTPNHGGLERAHFIEIRETDDCFELVE